MRSREPNERECGPGTLRRALRRARRVAERRGDLEAVAMLDAALDGDVDAAALLREVES